MVAATLEDWRGSGQLTTRTHPARTRMYLVHPAVAPSPRVSRAAQPVCSGVSVAGLNQCAGQWIQHHPNQRLSTTHTTQYLQISNGAAMGPYTTAHTMNSSRW